MTIRKKQFINALNHIVEVRKKATVKSEDVDYLLDAGFKLYLSFEELEQAREKWRLRAETAEAKLK